MLSQYLFIVQILAKLSKGKPVNIPALGFLGYIYGNVTEPRDASGASGKSSLFFLTVISSENADDRGSSLSGEAVRRLEKHSYIRSVRCGTNRP